MLNQTVRDGVRLLAVQLLLKHALGIGNVDPVIRVQLSNLNHATMEPFHNVQKFLWQIYEMDISRTKECDSVSRL